MIFDRIKHILLTGIPQNNKRYTPPTMLFNEGWLLRLVLDWFAQPTNQTLNHPLAIPSGTRWYSEALLPTRFANKPRAERHTHADGVIGHFTIGGTGEGDLPLAQDATHFVVIEAKLHSKLDPNVTNKPGYNQAARTVACMAEILFRSKRKSFDSFDKLGFYVIAPDTQIKKEVTFNDFLKNTDIEAKVKERVQDYKENSKNEWLRDWFIPMLNIIDLKLLTWEDVLIFIQQNDDKKGKILWTYYELCKHYNNIGKKIDDARLQELQDNLYD